MFRGVVEATIFSATVFKLLHPDVETSDLEARLSELSETGKTEVIRYKAYLSHLFITTPELMAKIPPKAYKDSAAFYKLLADSLNNQLLSAK